MNAIILPLRDRHQTQRGDTCCVRVQPLPVPHRGRRERSIDRDDKMPTWSGDSSRVGPYVALTARPSVLIASVQDEVTSRTAAREAATATVVTVSSRPLNRPGGAGQQRGWKECV